MANCIDKVLEKFPEADRKDLEEAFNAMIAIRQQGFLDASGNADASFMERAKALLDSHRRTRMVAEIRAMNDAISLNRVRKFANNSVFAESAMPDWAPEWMKGSWRGISPYAKGLQAFYTGTHRIIENGRLAFDTIRNETAGEQLSMFISEMDKVNGALQTLKSGTEDLNIIRARRYLSMGKEIPKGVFSAEVEGAARAWQKLSDMQLQGSNDAGAFVKKRMGHLFTHAWDPRKLDEAGMDSFKQWMMENLDHKISFERDFYKLDANETIEDAFNKIVKRDPNINFELADPEEALGLVDRPASMARSMEKSRTFEFRDADAEYAFMKQWSRYDTVAETIAQSMRSSGRRVSLLQKLGSNPEAMHNKLTAGLTPAEKAMLNRHWSVASGKSDIPGDDPVSKWMATSRHMANMGGLGYSTLRNFPDIGTQAATLQMEGKGFLGSVQDVITGFSKSITQEKRAPTMKLIGVGADSLIGEFFDRNGTTTGGHAWVSKANQQFFKIIGQRWWTASAEAGFGQVLAAGLGERSGMQFAKLEAPFAKVMQKYGIGPAEWEVMRLAVQDAGNGVKMIGSMPIRDLDDAAVKAIMDSVGIKGNVGKYKRGVAQKVGAYFRDRVDIGMNRAGDFEKASFLNRGYAEGTAEGQAMRFLGQFKSYSYTVASKFSKSYYHEALAGKSFTEGASTIAPVIVGLTALGYTGQVAWDLAHNRTPTPVTPKSVVDAMVRGGAGGIYGDYLLGTWDSRHGRDALSAFAGPVLGRGSDFMDLVSQFKEAGLRQDTSKIRASAISRFVFNIVPGNLPIVRPALDYLVLNHMAESLNPGYNGRMRRRLQDNGQSQLLPQIGNSLQGD